MLTRLKHDLTMAEAARGPGGSRVDLLVVADMVERGARVLDVGCGDGELLRLLETRGVDGRGIELSREGVNECVAKGLAVIQGDADTDLDDYPDDAFDFVILSQTLQATRQPRVVLEHMLRIGRHAIVSFPEFRPLAHPAAARASAATCRTPTICPMPGTKRPTSTSAASRISASSAGVAGAKMERGGGAQCLGPAHAAENAVVVLESVRRAGGVFAEPAGLGRAAEVQRRAIARVEPSADFSACPGRPVDASTGNGLWSDRRPLCRRFCV